MDAELRIHVCVQRNVKMLLKEIQRNSFKIEIGINWIFKCLWNLVIKP